MTVYYFSLSIGELKVGLNEGKAEGKLKHQTGKEEMREQLDNEEDGQNKEGKRKTVKNYHENVKYGMKGYEREKENVVIRNMIKMKEHERSKVKNDKVKRECDKW